VLTRLRLFGLISVLSLAMTVLASCREGLESDEEDAEVAAPAVSMLATTKARDDLAVADSAPLTDVEPTLTIVYTNNIDGEIEPCG